MKGLEVLLERLAEDPTKKIMKIRFLALVSEIEDSTEKAKWCLKLARFYGVNFPKEALQIAYMVCKYDPDNIAALNIIVDSFEALGKNGQAEALRTHLAKVRNDKADAAERDHLIRDLGVEDAFSSDEAEHTNPFNLSADQIMSVEVSIDDVIEASSATTPPNLDINEVSPKETVELDLTNKTLEYSNDEVEEKTIVSTIDPSASPGEDGWQFGRDLYKEGGEDTVFLDINSEEGKNILEKPPEVSIDFSESSNEQKSQAEASLDLFDGVEITSPFGQDPSQASDEIPVEQPEKNHPENIAVFGSKESEEISGLDITVSDKDHENIDKVEASNIEKTHQPPEIEFDEPVVSKQNFLLEEDAMSADIVSKNKLTRAEQFENLKQANFKNYDSELISKMFTYYIEKNDHKKAREILESSAAFCSSEKWWKNSFSLLLDQGGNSGIAGINLFDDQEELYQAEQIIKNYQKTGDEAPWATLAETLDSSKAMEYLRSFNNHHSLFLKNRFFLFYLDLAIICGYARIVLNELASVSLDLSDAPFRKEIFIRWQHANELLSFEIDLSSVAKKSDFDVAKLGSFEVSQLDEKSFKSLLSVRMKPTLDNYQL
jgi:hypothetical protein